MKMLPKRFSMLMIATLITGSVSFAQKTNANNNSQTSNQTQMKTYVIERNIPNAGKLTHEELKGIAQKSCSVVSEIGPDIKWLQSYVVADKLFCIYQATSEELIREHGKMGGFPVTNIYEVENTFSPATATVQ
jgi:hypothetical protein